MSFSDIGPILLMLRLTSTMVGKPGNGMYWEWQIFKGNQALPNGNNKIPSEEVKNDHVPFTFVKDDKMHIQLIYNL